MGCGAGTHTPTEGEKSEGAAAPGKPNEGAASSSSKGEPVGKGAAPSPEMNADYVERSAGASSRSVPGPPGSDKEAEDAKKKDAATEKEAADAEKKATLAVVQDVINGAEDTPQITFGETLDSSTFDISGAMVELRKLFDRLDVDNSGSVSKQEFVTESPKVSPKLLAGFDFNKYCGEDSTMNWLEFCAAMRSSGRTGKEVMEGIFKSTAKEADHELLDKQMMQAKEQFEKVAGVDGVVDVMEFFTKAETAPLFKNIGFAVAAGEDNKLSFEEFIAALKENGNIPRDASSSQS